MTYLPRFDVEGPNLVANPDVVEDTSGWSMISPATITATTDGGKIVAASGQHFLGTGSAIGFSDGQVLVLRFRYRRNSAAASRLRLQVTASYNNGTQSTFVANTLRTLPTQGVWVDSGDIICTALPAGMTSLVVAINNEDFSTLAFDYTVTGIELRDTALAGERMLSDILKLEVETDPPAGVLVNQIENPSGAEGGFGWITPVANSVLKGTRTLYTSNQQGLEYTTAANAGGNYFHSEEFPIAAGEYVNAKWRVDATPGFGSLTKYRVRIDWLDASEVYLSSSAYSTFTTNYADHKLAAAVLAPASTAYARILFEAANTSGTFPHTTAGQKFAVRQVTVVKGASAAAVADANFTMMETAEFWTDILGPTHSIEVNREELNLGTLTATVLDATLDPSQDDLIRPGKKIRLTSYNADSDTSEALYTGKISNGQVTYNPKETANNRSCRITLTALDNVQTLAQNSRPDGVADIEELPYVLEGCGVPWVTQGSSQQVASATVVSKNESASAVDQVAVTRDSAIGYAWVNRNNVLHAFWDPRDLEEEHNVCPNPNFENQVQFQWVAVSNCTIGGVTTGTPPLTYLDVTASAAGTIVFASDKVPVEEGLTVDSWIGLVANGATPRTAILEVEFYDAANVLQQAGAIMTGTTGVSMGALRTLSGSATALKGRGITQMRLKVYVQGCAAGEKHRARGAALFIPSTELTEADYSGIDVDFNTGDCINEVMVKYLQYDPTTGETTEVAYGPYRDTASIEEWGVRSAEFTYQGDVSAVADFAAYILRANAEPKVRINSVTLPIGDETDLTASGAFLDLYDRVLVRNANKGLADSSRVTSINHTITPESWLVTLGFSDAGTVAAPQLIPPVQNTPVALPKAYSNTASGAANVTGTTNVSVPGISRVVTVAAGDEFLVTLTMDVSKTGTDGTTFLGELTVDGNAQAHQIIFNHGAVQAIRATLTQTYLVTGLSAGDHTIAARARATAAGTWTVNSGAHTNMKIVRL